MPIDLVAGTSMGSIIGALYARALSPAELRRWRALDRLGHGVLGPGRPAARAGGLAGRRRAQHPLHGGGPGPVARPRGRLFRLQGRRRSSPRTWPEPALRAGGDFDRLAVPFRAVATDLATGERVVLAGRRSAAGRARQHVASRCCSLPSRSTGGCWWMAASWTTCRRGWCAHGGRRRGGGRRGRAAHGDRPKGADVLTVVRRMTELMMASGNRSFAEPPDVRMRPDFEGIESGDYDYSRRRSSGERAAAFWPSPRSRPCSAAAARAPRAAATGAARGPRGGSARSVTVEGLARVSERLVRRRLPRRGGSGAFDLATAQKGMDAVWASNLFSSAWLELQPAGNELDLNVQVRERPDPSRQHRGVLQRGRQRRGILRLRNGNLLGLGERLDTRSWPTRAARSCRPPWATPASPAPCRLPPRGAGRGGQAARLRRRGHRIGRTRFRQFRFTGRGPARRGPRRPPRARASWSGGRRWRAGGHSLRGASGHRGQGRGALRHSTASTTASGRRAEWRLDAPGRAVAHRARGQRPYWRASLRADAYARWGSAAISPDTCSPGARARTNGSPSTTSSRRGRAHPRSGPQPRRDLGQLGGGRLAGAGRAARRAWQVEPGRGVGKAWAERDAHPSGQPARRGQRLGRSRTTPVGPVVGRPRLWARRRQGLRGAGLPVGRAIRGAAEGRGSIPARGRHRHWRRKQKSQASRGEGGHAWAPDRRLPATTSRGSAARRARRFRGPIDPDELLVHAHRDKHPLEIAAQFAASRFIRLTGNERIAREGIRAVNRVGGRGWPRPWASWPASRGLEKRAKRLFGVRERDFAFRFRETTHL